MYYNGNSGEIRYIVFYAEQGKTFFTVYTPAVMPCFSFAGIYTEYDGKEGCLWKIGTNFMSKELLWAMLKVILEVIIILIDFYINVK